MVQTELPDGVLAARFVVASRVTTAEDILVSWREIQSHVDGPQKSGTWSSEKQESLARWRAEREDATKDNSVITEDSGVDSDESLNMEGLNINADAQECEDKGDVITGANVQSSQQIRKGTDTGEEGSMTRPRTMTRTVSGLYQIQRENDLKRR